MKVLITSRTFGKDDATPRDTLRKAGYQLVINETGRQLTHDELLDFVGDVDGVIAGLDRFDREVIEQGERLKVISRYGVGVNNVDLAAATERGVMVTNTPSVNSCAVAELAFGLILSAARRISFYDRSMRSRVWTKTASSGTELEGKTLGVLGTGQIGRKLAEKAVGFGMVVVCFDVAPNEQWAAQLAIEYVSLSQVLSRSDIVSIHVPLTIATTNLLSKQELSMMKPGAILVNTARGGIVDEQALYEALLEGHLAGAGLDVFGEDPPTDSPLLELDNVVLTPHIGSDTLESHHRMAVVAVDNLLDALAGRLPANLVNSEVYRATDDQVAKSS